MARLAHGEGRQLFPESPICWGVLHICTVACYRYRKWANRCTRSIEVQLHTKQTCFPFLSKTVGWCSDESREVMPDTVSTATTLTRKKFIGLFVLPSTQEKPLQIRCHVKCSSPITNKYPTGTISGTLASWCRRRPPQDDWHCSAAHHSHVVARLAATHNKSRTTCFLVLELRTRLDVYT